MTFYIELFKNIYFLSMDSDDILLKKTDRTFDQGLFIKNRENCKLKMKDTLSMK